MRTIAVWRRGAGASVPATTEEQGRERRDAEPGDLAGLGAAPGAAEQPYLERLGYTRPKNLHEKLYARLVTLALRSTA